MTARLLFCKSQVYIHRSKDARDNLNGFIIITQNYEDGNNGVAGVAGPSGSDSLLSWISITSLNNSQRDWLLKQEDKLIENIATNSYHSKKVIKMNSQILNCAKSNSIGSFSVLLNSLYSIEFRDPSPSGWWYGSIVLHSLSPIEDSILPVLFFHDDLCPSTIKRQSLLKKSFDPFASTGNVYWGGIDLRNKISELVDLKRTQLDKSVWLINATLDDLRNFSSDKLNQTDLNSTSTNNNNNNGSTISGQFWKKFEDTKWSVMSQIANATSKTGLLVSNLVKRHPVIQFIDRNRENRYIKQMLENPRVQEVQNDFDSASIYLAKWALGVKEEVDRYQLNNRLNDTYRKLLTKDLGFDITGDTTFTPLEINKALERSFPLTKTKWDSFFDSQGRLCITVNEIKDYIFHGGIDTMELRKDVWLFLLDVYPWDSSKDERDQILATLTETYQEYKNKWMFRVTSFDDTEEMVKEEEYWNDQVFRIDKDVLRNDRNIPLYHFNTVDGKPDKPKGNGNEDDSNPDNWSINNPHLLKLRDILKTYNVLNNNLGYVQGMCDLLSPIYYVFQDEVLAFWCFVKFMDRMERNFLRDQSGIRDQMLTLSELTTMMLPQLSEHLQKCDSSNLFFCFRMLLVWFKREFSFNDVCSIWEIFWTDYYTSQFQIFFMLAILQKNSQPIIQHLNQFDQVIKFFNDLHNTMDWNDLMVRSELLFIRFQKLMNVMDRRTQQNYYHQQQQIPSGTDQEDEEEIIIGVTNDNGITTSGVELHEVDSNGEEHPVDEENEKKYSPNSSPYLQLLLKKTLIIQREPPRTHESVK